MPATNTILTPKDIATHFPSYQLLKQALELQGCQTDITGHTDPDGNYHMSIEITGAASHVNDKIIEELKSDKHLTFTFK